LQSLLADGYLKYFVFDPSFNLLTSDLESVSGPSADGQIPDARRRPL